MTFKIHTIPHTQFAAKHLVEQLRKLGHDCELVNEVLSDDAIYIIYNASVFGLNNHMPKNYIVYQTEVAGSHWFTPAYFQIIRKALAVWEYSEVNTRVYKHLNSNISIVTPGIAPQPVKEKTIDLLFYGWIKNSARRNLLLSRYLKTHAINIVTDIMGDTMAELLSRAKIVLNLHYYDKSPFEVFRINEALSHGCHVISEGPFCNEYLNYVHFYRNDAELDALITKCKGIPFSYNLSALDNLGQVKAAVATLQSMTHTTAT